MTDASASESGFSLIEMMVTLAIVSLVGLAGLSLVDSLSTAQLRTDDRYARMMDLQILISGVTEDLDHADLSTLSLANGRLQFDTRRCGQAVPVLYEYRETSVRRPSGACVGSGVELQDFDQVTLLILDSSGSYNAIWPVESDREQVIGGPQPAIAQAIEIRLELAEAPAMPAGTIRRLVELPRAPN